MSTTTRTGRRCLADFTAETLSVEEAGEVVGLSRASAYSAVRRGEIPSIRIGGKLLVPRHRLEVLLGHGDRP